MSSTSICEFSFISFEAALFKISNPIAFPIGGGTALPICKKSFYNLLTNVFCCLNPQLAKCVGFSPVTGITELFFPPYLSTLNYCINKLSTVQSC